MLVIGATRKNMTPAASDAARESPIAASAPALGVGRDDRWGRGLNSANRRITAIGHIPTREKLLWGQRFENSQRFQCFGDLFKRQRAIDDGCNF